MVLLSIYPTIANYTSETGAMPMLFSIRDSIPIAFPALLLTIFFVLFAGNYFLNKGKTGRAKVLIAMLASSFIMLVLSMFMALSLLVTFKTVLFYAFLLILSFILFVLSDKL